MKMFKTQLNANGDRVIYRKTDHGWQYVSPRAAVMRLNKAEKMKGMSIYVKHSDDCPVSIVHYRYHPICNCGLESMLDT